MTINETFENLSVIQIGQLAKMFNEPNMTYKQLVRYYEDFVDSLVDDHFINWEYAKTIEVKIPKINKPIDEMVKEMINDVISEIGVIFKIDIDSNKYVKEGHIWGNSGDFIMQFGEIGFLKLYGDYTTQDGYIILNLNFETTWFFTIFDNEEYTLTHYQTPHFDMIKKAFQWYDDFKVLCKKLDKVFTQKFIKNMEKEVITNMTIRYFKEK